MTTVAIPALSCGNMASVARMIEYVGGSPRIIANPREIDGAERLVIAGVGAFDHGMTCIRSGGWEEAFVAARDRGVPILGICLGMQMLLERSEEGVLPGLGWIPGSVIRFQAGENAQLKIPHMGWSEIRVTRPNPLLDPADGEQSFYFVHSYHAVCSDATDSIATARHGIEFTCAVRRANVLGAQFHPEKSHRYGMALFRRFLGALA